MPIKDDFSYKARWDSVGLDCSNCQFENAPDQWPDKKKVYSCNLHKISLVVELNEKGFKDGEWFCKNFDNIGGANPEAVKHFKEIKARLQDGALYGFYGKDGNLKEIPFLKIQEP